MLSISIAEDNVDYALLLAEHFQRSGRFDVKAIYHCACDAVKDLKLHPVDILVVDVDLNGSSGICLMDELKNAQCRTRFLVLTGHHDDAIFFDAIDAGAHGYLLKDASMERIEEAVIDLARGGSPISPAMSFKLVNSFRQMRRKANEMNMLSSREKEVMQQISKGLLYKEIANTLGIERETVKKHLSKIYSKLNVQNKVEALNRYFGH
ncbi:MAG TPA: response regulator transcription factor [Puia sp.]|nr:response regulator transcription factor [Puia sp.]